MHVAHLYVIGFNLRMFWVKSLVYYGNDYSFTCEVSFPNINHIVCRTINSVLKRHKRTYDLAI